MVYGSGVSACVRAPVQDIVLVHVLDRAENLLKHVEHTLLAQRLLLLRQQLRKSPANTQSVCCIYKNVVNDVHSPAVCILHLDHDYTVFFEAVEVTDDVWMVKHGQHSYL